MLKHRRVAQERSNRRSTCGSKGGGSQYDPQVGEAAKQNADNAAQAQQFSQNYYTNTVAPLLAQETAQSKITSDNENKLFGLNYDQAQKAAAIHTQYGLPAAKSYYNMVNNYSSKAEEQRQADSAIGDMRSAEASQAGTLTRQRQSYGIDPTSGVAQSDNTNMAVQNSAAEAAAATRARYNAKNLGMQLTADAANYSNGGYSAIASTSGSAGAASQGAFGAAAGATTSGNQSASVPLQGYQIAGQGYSANLDAYSRLGSADIQAQAAGDSGLGSFLGGLGALAMKVAVPSDRRLKDNIVHVGEWKSLPVYEYNYKGSSARFRGVMADDVQKVMPQAVHRHPHGYLVVDYDMLRAAA